MLAVLLISAAASVSAQTLHDPMQPDRKPRLQRATAPSAPSLRLDSTVVRQGQSVAVINGRPWKVGEHYRGMQLLSVAPGRARVRWRGEQIELQMPQVAVREQQGGQ